MQWLPLASAALHSWAFFLYPPNIICRAATLQQHQPVGLCVSVSTKPSSQRCTSLPAATTRMAFLCAFLVQMHDADSSTCLLSTVHWPHQHDRRIHQHSTI